MSVEPLLGPRWESRVAWQDCTVREGRWARGCCRLRGDPVWLAGVLDDRAERKTGGFWGFGPSDWRSGRAIIETGNPGSSGSGLVLAKSEVQV